MRLYRHHTLQSVIARSDAFLDENGRHALRDLSIFPAKPNTFSEEAALAIISPTPVTTLDSLCDSGLLEINANRYTLHQTIADYARSQSDEKPFQAFIGYYQRYIEQNQRENANLERESQNIFAALDMARRLYPQTFIQMVFALTNFLLHHGLYEQGKILLEQVYQATTARRNHA